MAGKNYGRTRPNQGIISSMMRARNVTGRGARGAVIATALVAVALPFTVQAQGAPAAAVQASLPAAAPAAAAPQFTPMRPMTESVAAIVNDDIISTYDLAQRMRLLIATSGVQPTQDTLPEFQQEALRSLVDERLQIQELKRVQKDQKITIIATDDEIQEELTGMAQQNNLKPEGFLAALKSQGIASDTLYEQIRAQMSWQRWIRGRYGTRLRIGEDQIKATQARLIAAASKPQYEVSEVFLDAGRAGGMDAAVKGATQLVAQIQQGAPFAAVARQFSAASTAAAGGEAGWISQGEMPAQVDAVLDQLRPGQLSQPIPVKDGVYIIYLRDKRSGSGQTLVNLKQAAIALPATATDADVEAARVKLEGVKASIKDCQTLEATAGKTPGVVAGDLGEAEINDLSPEFKDAAQTLKVGQLSSPIRTKVGLHVLAVCGKRSAGAAQADHDQIESRLTGQQLSMISRRYMRDLRTSATIETR
ncbi:MAG: peptidyl-prolyl cis-trans isomerase family protein [Phenylobacterium sp.]|jgi:peptidyl-prolyl cis-trans isomerase SurA|nr:peptidyl-prolyl cis-trans isomerase family protein [Phenylobacterium sp.]